MVESGGDSPDPAAGESARASLLRTEYLSQTARIPWQELQTWYARGSVISVAGKMNLVEVAVQLGLDNSAQFEQWISAGEVAPVSDEQALAWYEVNQELWAVVAPPWVLVQQRQSAETASESALSGQ